MHRSAEQTSAIPPASTARPGTGVIERAARAGKKPPCFADLYLSSPSTPQNKGCDEPPFDALEGRLLKVAHALACVPLQSPVALTRFLWMPKASVTNATASSQRRFTSRSP